MIQILIVDDEKPICDLIQMSLTRAGYRCTCVYDGLAAADILEHNVFDLILLDVMLPNADGFELMEYIRPLGIPVIFLTARGLGRRPGARPAHGRGGLHRQALRGARAACARGRCAAALQQDRCRHRDRRAAHRHARHAVWQRRRRRRRLTHKGI